MFRVSVLASGSKGNCTVIATSRTRIAVDAGLSCREIVKRMRFSGEEPEKLDGILITHEHQDHVQGLSVLARRWKVPVYTTDATHEAWKRWMLPRKEMSFKAWLEMRRQEIESSLVANAAPEEDTNSRTAARVAECSGDLLDLAASSPQQQGATAPIIPIVPVVMEQLSAEQAQPAAFEPEFGPEFAPEFAPELVPEFVHEQFLPPDPPAADPAYLPCLEYFRAGIRFQIGDISVTPFTIPHDAADPVGFVLEAEGMRVVIATDLGYLPPNVRMHLAGADMLIVESNYDVEMLRDGPYPWAVKQRVLSRTGHLSNEALGEYLASDYDGAARFVVLAHLSENNNLPELARISAERALQNRMRLLGNQVLLASQCTPLESIYL